MRIRDGIFTTVAVALSGVALAGLLGTDAYSQAAGAEARGLKALSMQVEMRCGEPCVDGGAGRWAVANEGGRP
ncbi:hypothetical protein [Massilia sp. BSC265]|uniref:hypothetical protein n=1 Tax=Massilia sp. BSC265 TaxID=1549812 RepID=UPI00056D2D6E|nr:hypothetical protein [Massilia sp. BSC265]